MIVSAVLEGFKDKWEHYYTTKERKHRHSVVGEESILHPHASAMSMSSMKDKMENFLVCSFFFFTLLYILHGDVHFEEVVA